MRVAGIIAEYDPFHNGHAAHIAATRAAGYTHIAVVMSGSFTQRGEPAMLTKWHRTEAALAGGADLILELPLPWAMAPAEMFAAGGVAVLNALGAVEALSFGSECGSVGELAALAAAVETPEYNTALHRALETGIPYAAARQRAAEAVGCQYADLMDFPNNLLAAEYIRAAEKQKSGFSFFTVRRQGAAHDGTQPRDGIASAGYIRQQINGGEPDKVWDLLPASSAAILRQALADGRMPADPRRLEGAILARLRTMSREEYAALPYLSEGLENRLYRASRTAVGTEDLLSAVKTRRYPMARLKRILYAALIGLPGGFEDKLPPYIRVLGMNDRGREILSAAAPALPILSRAAQFGSLEGYPRQVFDLECKATDLHGLTFPDPIPCAADLTTKCIVRPAE